MESTAVKSSTQLLTFSTFAIALACAVLLVVSPPVPAPEAPHASTASLR